MEDDIRIIAHSKYDSYPTGYSEEDATKRASYVLKEHQYFLDHTDYESHFNGPIQVHHGDQNAERGHIQPASEGLALLLRSRKGNV